MSQKRALAQEIRLGSPDRCMHRVSLVRPCGARSQRGFLRARKYNAKHSKGVSGMLAQEKFLHLNHMRVLLKPSETTITTQNLWQLDCNFAWSRLGAPSLRNQPLCSATSVSLGSCRFECFMFAGHEAVIYMEMCAVSGRSS